MDSEELKKRFVLTLAAPLVALPLLVIGQSAEAQQGPEVFKKYKCMECHSVKAAGIDKVAKKGGDKDDDDEGGESKGEKKEPPDLSDVGTKHNASWMQAYLKKKEKIEGVAHRKRFKGSKEELETLTAWMETLKKK